jgi:hypothetical protein
MNKVIVGALVALMTGVGWAATPSAQADDQGCINELHADGVAMLTGENFWVINCHKICDTLRSGVPPERLYDQFGLQNFQGPQIVAAAQHNVCPDTLGR